MSLNEFRSVLVFFLCKVYLGTHLVGGDVVGWKFFITSTIYITFHP